MTKMMMMMKMTMTMMRMMTMMMMRTKMPTTKRQKMMRKQQGTGASGAETQRVTAPAPQRWKQASSQRRREKTIRLTMKRVKRASAD